MTPDKSPNGKATVLNTWFNFFMALTVVGLGFIGVVVLEFKRDITAKLDRVTMLFQEEKRVILTKLDGACDKLTEHEKRIVEHRVLLKMPYTERKTVMTP